MITRFLPSAKIAAIAGIIATCAPLAANAAHPDALHPFSADSPWNIRPDKPELGDYVLPPTRYHPFVGPGDYSTGVFIARPEDPPITIVGPDGDSGTWCADAETRCVVRLPHWPARVDPAHGTDGHAEIIDPSTGIVHSFWQLRHIGSSWHAAQYTWSRLDGRGWGDPAHYQQGPCAAGVPVLGGLIRKAEINDGLPVYRHAIALALDGSAMARGYVFPATSEDNNAAENYRGGIPMGTLLMLPHDFDPESLQTPALRKIARTLRVYGARVIDQNVGTRFSIGVENGSQFNLHPGGWNPAAADDLDRIADALRPVRAQAGWIDNAGHRVTLSTKLNLLSLRGPWMLERGSVAGRFESWQQALVFDDGDDTVIQEQRTGNGLRPVPWAALRIGKRYRFTTAVTGDATLALSFIDGSGTVRWYSGPLSNGGSAAFTFAANDWRPILTAVRRHGPAHVTATLVEID